MQIKALQHLHVWPAWVCKPAQYHCSQPKALFKGFVQAPRNPPTGPPSSERYAHALLGRYFHRKKPANTPSSPSYFNVLLVALLKHARVAYKPTRHSRR